MGCWTPSPGQQLPRPARAAPGCALQRLRPPRWAIRAASSHLVTSPTQEFLCLWSLLRISSCFMWIASILACMACTHPWPWLQPMVRVLCRLSWMPRQLSWTWRLWCTCSLSTASPVMHQRARRSEPHDCPHWNEICMLQPPIWPAQGSAGLRLPCCHPGSRLHTSPIACMVHGLTITAAHVSSRPVTWSVVRCRCLQGWSCRCLRTPSKPCHLSGAQYLCL